MLSSPCVKLISDRNEYFAFSTTSLFSNECKYDTIRFSHEVFYPVTWGVYCVYLRDPETKVYRHHIFVHSKKMAVSFKPNEIVNKKVLLHERKRHTARHVVSTHSVVLSWLTPPPAGLTPPQLDWPPWLDWPPPAGLTHLPPAGLTPTRWTDPPWLDWPPPPAELADWPPSPMDRQTDRHVSKHYLPVVLRTRAVKIVHKFDMLEGWGGRKPCFEFRLKSVHGRVPVSAASALKRFR